MKTKTTTREYDEKGRMVRETVVEQDATPNTTWVYGCSCWAGGFCPMHGHRHVYPRPYTTWTASGIVSTKDSVPLTQNTVSIGATKVVVT